VPYLTVFSLSLYFAWLRDEIALKHVGPQFAPPQNLPHTLVGDTNVLPREGERERERERGIPDVAFSGGIKVPS